MGQDQSNTSSKLEYIPIKITVDLMSGKTVDIATHNDNETFFDVKKFLLPKIQPIIHTLRQPQQLVFSLLDNGNDNIKYNCEKVGDYYIPYDDVKISLLESKVLPRTITLKVNVNKREWTIEEEKTIKKFTQKKNLVLDFLGHSHHWRRCGDSSIEAVIEGLQKRTDKIETLIIHEMEMEDIMSGMSVLRVLRNKEIQIEKLRLTNNGL